MSKKESNLKNMLLALFAITLVASASLGGVYQLTKEPIEAARLEKKNNAIRQVIPEFEDTPTAETYKKAVEGDTLYFYPGRKDGELVGTAVESFSNQGFSGEIRIMVGILPGGIINDVAVLHHEETPGLGDKMQRNKSDWSKQFQDVNPESFGLQVKKDGGDVDAITAATISSRAFCDAVKRAYDAYENSENK